MIAIAVWANIAMQADTTTGLEGSAEHYDSSDSIYCRQQVKKM